MFVLRFIPVVHQGKYCSAAAGIAVSLSLAVALGRLLENKSLFYWESYK
jgi:hypothetical protein